MSLHRMVNVFLLKEEHIKRDETCKKEAHLLIKREGCIIINPRVKRNMFEIYSSYKSTEHI